MVVHPGQHAQQPGQIANVFVQTIIRLQGVDQTALTDFSVALHRIAAAVGGGLSPIFTTFVRGHDAQTLQFFQGIVDQVGVLNVHDETNVGQALVARAVADMVQHQNIQGRQIFQPRSRHAVHDPSVKGIARHDQAKLKLAHFGTLRRDQMGR